MLHAALILALANCAALPNPDDRAYCRAIEQNSPARCVEIQNYDLRQQCRAELGDGPPNCNSIDDFQACEMCKARSKDDFYDRLKIKESQQTCYGGYFFARIWS